MGLNGAFLKNSVRFETIRDNSEQFETFQLKLAQFSSIQLNMGLDRAILINSVRFETIWDNSERFKTFQLNLKLLATYLWMIIIALVGTENDHPFFGLENSEKGNQGKFHLGLSYAIIFWSSIRLGWSWTDLQPIFNWFSTDLQLIFNWSSTDL